MFVWSHWFREVSEIFSHAEKSVAKQFGRVWEAVMDDTSGIGNPQSIQTVIGCH